MIIGNREFDFIDKTYIMGILNVTPDSFSDGGLYNDPERALDQALRMQEEGADLLDVGGESSRPGSREVSLEEERKRVIPVLRKIVPRLKIPVSIDTRKSHIVEESLREGAVMVNDISALRHDFRMAEVIAEAGIPCILMHMRGEPETMQKDVRYLNVVSEIIHFLKGQMEIALRFGIERSRILVDPGIGFGKRLEDNLAILRSLPEFRVLEAPIVIGASRKTFIRTLLEETDPSSVSVQRGSLTAAAIAAFQGAGILRVHDVRPTREILRIVEGLRPSR